MTASTHRKIRKNGRNWVTKINKKGKQPLVAPVVVDGPVLMASTTIGTQANSSDFIFYKGGQSKNTRMSFIIDTTKNPDNASDNTIIIPFTLYTPSYSFTIDWGDGNSTTYATNTVLTTVGLTHTYSTAGQYTIVITSDSQKIPVLNWSTSGNVGGNKHKLIQLSTPLITFDTACPNSNSVQYFAYECDNLLFIANQFFINNPHLRNYNYCFSKCSKLVKVPSDMFKYAKYQSTYQEVFAHDIALQFVPDDLFATAKGLDFSGAFNGDSNLVLDVDLENFFGTEPYINTDVHEIFRDCVKTTGDAEEFIKFFTRYVAYVNGDGTFDTGWGTLTGKIYAQEIYNSDGQLVRDLVPAKTGNFYNGRTAPQDCLYDTIADEFLLPTSPFVYGVEVDDSRENNLPNSFKKNALYNCNLWTNFALPERVWTGSPSDREGWLATDETKEHWLIVDTEHPFTLEGSSFNLMCGVNDVLKADTNNQLGWLTGDRKNREYNDFTRGIIKPDSYATASVLRNIINALPELRGYTVVGNPTIVDGVASGFSNSGYLTIPAPNLSMVNDWEFVTKVNIPRLSNTFQVFLTGSLNHQFAGIDIDENGLLGAAIGNSSGDGWQIIENSTNWVGTRKMVPLNTDFWAKLTFNGSKYSVYYSADGENWEETVYFNSTQKVYHDPTNIISIGIGRSLQGLVFYGSIDLNETYIKVNNKVWFDGTEKLNEVVDLSGCINKGGLTSAELQTIIDKGYTLVLN